MMVRVMTRSTVWMMFGDGERDDSDRGENEDGSGQVFESEN